MPLLARGDSAPPPNPRHHRPLLTPRRPAASPSPPTAHLHLRHSLFHSPSSLLSAAELSSHSSAFPFQIRPPAAAEKANAAGADQEQAPAPVAAEVKKVAEEDPRLPSPPPLFAIKLLVSGESTSNLNPPHNQAAAVR